MSDTAYDDHYDVETYEPFDAQQYQRDHEWLDMGYWGEMVNQFSCDVDHDGRVWVETYDRSTDAHIGSHVVAVMPPAQRYGWMVECGVLTRRHRAEVEAERLTTPCPDCGKVWASCDCPF